MLVAGGKPRYQVRWLNVAGVQVINPMRHLLALAVVLFVALAGITPAAAFEVVTAPEDVNAVNLTSAVEIAPGTNGKIQLSTAPGEDGIIRRIEVLAGANGTNPNWGLFALKNDSD